jgi:hypothetical protein
VEANHATRTEDKGIECEHYTKYKAESMVYYVILIAIAVWLVYKGYRSTQEVPSKRNGVKVVLVRDGKSVTYNNVDDDTLQKVIREASKTGSGQALESPSENKGFSHAQIAWEDTQDPPLWHNIQYADRYGEYSKRRVAVKHFKGIHANGNEYLGAFENGKFKSFRRDRIISIEQSHGALPKD